jgi:hypothetical protein
MKLSLHGGKGAASHNDMSKQLFAWNDTRCMDNRYWCAGMTIPPQTAPPSFLQAELLFYESKYKQFLDTKNKENLRKGRRERIQTLDKLYKSSRYAPHELILQIGDQNEHITPAQLWTVTLDLVKQMESKHIHVLNVALHCHETTPHVHIRYVADYDNAKGLLQPCMDAALRLEGYELPDISQKNSRYNNRLTTYHRQLREHVAEFCRTELNLELDMTVYEEHKRYKTCSEYDREQKYQEMDNITHAIRQAHDEYIKLTEKNDTLQQNINELQNLQQDIQQTVDVLSQEENRLVFASWLIDNPDVLFAAQELAAGTMRQEFEQYIGVDEEELGNK